MTDLPQRKVLWVPRFGKNALSPCSTRHAWRLKENDTEGFVYEILSYHGVIILIMYCSYGCDTRSLKINGKNWLKVRNAENSRK